MLSYIVDLVRSFIPLYTLIWDIFLANNKLVHHSNPTKILTWVLNLHIYSAANIGKYMSVIPSYCCYFKRGLPVMPWLLKHGKRHFFWSWIRPFVSHGTVPVMPLLLFCQPSMAHGSLHAMTHLDRCRILWGIHTSGFGYPVRRFS